MFTRKMKSITVGYVCGSQPLILRRHIQTWREYPDWIKKKLEFILVYVGPNKDIVSLKPMPDLNISLYLLEKFKPWNYGAKNLIFHVASNKWVFLSDLDHLIEKEAIVKIAKLEQTKRFFYMFKRYNPELEVESQYNQSCHPGTFYMSKKIFWRVGGIEEDLSGYYGYEDVLLKECLLHYGHKIVIPSDIFLRNYSLSKQIPDADYRNKNNSWSRDSERNLKIINYYRKNRYKLSHKHLRFQWRRVL